MSLCLAEDKPICLSQLSHTFWTTSHPIKRCWIVSYTFWIVSSTF